MNVTPIRSTPVLVEPGQSVADAEWQAGWKACRATAMHAVENAYTRGYAAGSRAHQGGPSWLDLAALATLALIVGLLVGANLR